MAKEFVTLMLGRVVFNRTFEPGDNIVPATWDMYHGSSKEPTLAGEFEDFLYDPVADRTFRFTYSANLKHLPKELRVRFGRTAMQAVADLPSAFDHSVISRDVAGEDFPSLVFVVNNPTPDPITVVVKGWQQKFESSYILVEEMVTIETPDNGLL